METAMSVVNYNPTTKEQIATFTDKIVGEVESGAISALELHVKLTAIESCFKQIKERIAESVMNEANVYTEKSFELFGAKVEKAELGTKYDFTLCNDPKYHDYKAEQEKIDKEIKEREKFLKAIPGSIELTDETTGEVVTVYPPTKSSKSGIKVTLK